MSQPCPGGRVLYAACLSKISAHLLAGDDSTQTTRENSCNVRQAVSARTRCATIQRTAPPAIATSGRCEHVGLQSLYIVHARETPAGKLALILSTASVLTRCAVFPLHSSRCFAGCRSWARSFRTAWSAMTARPARWCRCRSRTATCTGPPAAMRRCRMPSISTTW